MAIFDNCLLASDVDETLVDSGYISPRNLEAIKYFKQNGGTFVLSTGRGLPALDQIFALMDKDLVGPCVVLNGGIIYDFQKDEPLMAKTLGEEAKKDTLYIKENCPEIGIEIHADMKIYVMHKTDETEFHEDYELMDREYVDFADVKDIAWNKVLYTCNNYETREAVHKALCAYDRGNSHFAISQTVVNGIWHPYIEQLPPNTTKANALKDLCKILGIKKNGFFAIGDYYNDVEMLKAADISACPLNAPDDIKELTNFVGCRCRDGAVADFIEYLTSLEEKTWTTTRKKN